MTDFASNFTNALTAGYQGRALRDAADERQRRRALAPDVQAAIGGDAQALGRVAAVDADYAVKLGPILQAMSEKQRAAAKAGAEFTYNAANAVLQTDPANRPTVYRQMLEQGKAMGHNMASLPGEYTPQMDGMLRSYRQMAIPVLDQWKAEQDRPQPMGGGAAGAISGIESGGRYDAVGPSATPQGNRAYGKYQVMDFNVGPWTQEILGKAMTPQEFAASPEAQEKVFEAKFGQYTKQFGTPQAAARAWFAGPGGMNNPNATDVNGVSVAQYENKFNATGGGIPQQGDGGPPGSPAGMPQTPANDPRAAIRGVQLPPGAKFMGVKGVPIVKDGAVMVLMPDGTPDFIPLPQRKEPGNLPPAGPFAGTSVDAQSLNMLIANGTLTRQQAAELGAGKTITNPADGSIIFMTPSGLVRQPAPAGAPGVPGSAPPPSAGGGAPATSSQLPPGAVQLTPPKANGPTPAEMGKFREGVAEGQTIIAALEKFREMWKSAPQGQRLKSLTGANTPLSTAYSNAALLAKGEALYNLGVLNGPDLAIIRRTLADPAALSSTMTSDADVDSSIDQVVSLINTRISNKAILLGVPIPQGQAAPKAADPLDGQTATNPQTGEKIIRRGGQWVPVPRLSPGSPSPNQAGGQ